MASDVDDPLPDYLREWALGYGVHLHWDAVEGYWTAVNAEGEQCDSDDPIAALARAADEDHRALRIELHERGEHPQIDSDRNIDPDE